MKNIIQVQFKRGNKQEKTYRLKMYLLFRTNNFLFYILQTFSKHRERLQKSLKSDLYIQQISKP